MEIKIINQQVSVSDQIHASDIALLKAEGYDVIICNRPDHEVLDQPAFNEIKEAAEAEGLKAFHLPFSGSELSDDTVNRFIAILKDNKRILSYCRTGNRSCSLWAASAVKQGEDSNKVIAIASSHGYDVKTSVSLFADIPVSVEEIARHSMAKPKYDIVIVGGGSAGIATASSLLKRHKSLRIAIVEPSDHHYYQPGWTMVGGGIFSPESTCRSTNTLMPREVSWLKNHVVKFFPEDSLVALDNGQEVYYEHLVVCPGLKLDWSAIEGLEESLGKNGVTSNYRYDLAPYTWKLVSEMTSGKAVFTQPPMPIKCAGAPQKAMYLSADHWFQKECLNDIDIHFFNTGGVIFGVEDYVPALEQYLQKYQVNTHYLHQLVRIDGTNKKAYFRLVEDGVERLMEQDFDMIHVCPPQSSPDFVAESSLADADGWLDVEPYTLRHKRYDNVWGVGDVLNTANAKTMAAVRKQAPVVAENIYAALCGSEPQVGYSGYGSCPLTVERGKIVLAEFGYGGKLEPTFPQWLLEGTKPTWLAWWLKKDVLPFLYWKGMLKGREPLAKPQRIDLVRQ